MKIMDTQLMWENSCRLCSEEKNEMVQIFGEEGLRRQIAQKLRVCLPVMVYKTDPLPKQICQFCAARLDDVFEFREYCLNIYKSMHMKLLASKNLNSVKIFLDAMINSPDPCQVKLSMIKQRAPPPLVPLLSSLTKENSQLSITTIPNLKQMDMNVELLPELPCEVQIKEEPFDITITKVNLVLNGDNSNHSIADDNFREDNESSNEKLVDYVNESNGAQSESTNDEKKTSILEQVLTGNLRINDCQKLVPKTKLSSEWWCSPCNNYYRTKESLVKHMQLYCPRKYTYGKRSFIFETVEELAKHEAENDLKINLDFDKSVKECHQCDREFVSWEMLNHHRLHDHLPGSVEFGTNTWCNRFLPNEELYYNHQELHDINAFPDRTGDETNADGPNIQENLKEITREHFIECVKSLTCPTCGKVCTQQSALSNHMRAHEPKKHKCNICGRLFGLFIRLATHKLSEHNVQPTPSIMTSVEQEEVLNAEREARESRGANLKKSIRCRTLSETLDNDEQCIDKQRPPKRNASNMATRCGICQKSFNDHTTMLTHLQTHSGNIFPKYSTRSTREKSFKEKWPQQRHEESPKRTKSSIYECSVCSKHFLNKAQLDAHEKIHIVDKSYHCPKCNKIFFKESSLITHQCTTISPFIKQGSTKTHMNYKKITSVIDNKKYKYPKCTEMFDTTQLKNSHTRIHVKSKLPSINLISNNEDDSIPKLKPEELLSTPILLLEPKVEIKEDQNPLVPQKRTLIRTTGGYRCGVCQSPFVLRELAVAHLRSAHPVMPYQCPYCKKRFTTQYSFTHHIKTDHPNESEK